jgi:hypothetical protein
MSSQEGEELNPYVSPTEMSKVLRRNSTKKKFQRKAVVRESRPHRQSAQYGDLKRQTSQFQQPQSPVVLDMTAPMVLEKETAIPVLKPQKSSQSRKPEQKRYVPPNKRAPPAPNSPSEILSDLPDLGPMPESWADI